MAEITRAEQLRNNFTLFLGRMRTTGSVSYYRQCSAEALYAAQQYRELTGENLLDTLNLTTCKGCGEILSKPLVTCSDSCYRDAYIQ